MILGVDSPRLFGINRVNSRGEDQLFVWNSDNNGIDSIAIPFTNGEWLQITMVHSQGTLMAYKNGVLIGTVASGPTYVPNGTLDGNLYLGGSGRSNSTFYFQGQIDEVRIWNTAIPADVIQAWAFSELNEEHANYANLSAYYMMTDGSGVTLSDNSPNSNIGSLTGGMSDQNWVSSEALNQPGEPTETPASPFPTATATPGITNTPDPFPTQTNTPSVSHTATSTSPPGTQDGFIVDHNSIDLFSQIPDQFIDAAAQIDSLFRHASVGNNVDNGLNCLMNNFPSRPYYCDSGLEPEEIFYDQRYDRSNWVFEFHASTNLNPGWWNKTNYFIDRINNLASDEHYDAVAFKFGYVDGTDDLLIDNKFFSNDPDDNLPSIDELETLQATHPDKNLILWTMSLARAVGTVGSDSFNQQMRAYAAAHNKILMDIAAIQSHRPDGTLCFDNAGNGIPALCDEYTNEVNGGHLNALGMQRMAKAYWILMAKLAGWDGFNQMPTSTISPSTAVPTSTLQPPTATSVPSQTPEPATPTNTVAAPTPTWTLEPPTPTNTTQPPTPTNIPEFATPSPTQTPSGLPVNLVEVGFFDTSGFAYTLEIFGDYAYLADITKGFKILDISDPTTPFEVGAYQTLGRAYGEAVHENYAYVTDSRNGLTILDISDPANLVEIGSISTQGFPWEVSVYGNLAYLVERWDGLTIIDISDPSNPVEVGSIITPDQALDVEIRGNYAYVAAYTSGLRIIDISDPSNPTEVGSYDTPGNCYRVLLVGDTVYAADGARGLRIIDISDPTNPVEIGYYQTTGFSHSMALLENTVILADWAGGITVVDITDLSNPVEIDHFETPGKARDVYISGNYAYLADYESGLRIYSLYGNP